jgi:4a-hydroxytetrahydrobiopterin dehydratase
MGLRDPLSAEEVSRRLREPDGWVKAEDREEIHKTFHLDYYTSVKAINDVLAPARELQHHPDIDLRRETLHFSLTTYGAGHRITELDFLLADRIERVLKNYTDISHHALAGRISTGKRPGAIDEAALLGVGIAGAVTLVSTPGPWVFVGSLLGVTLLSIVLACGRPGRQETAARKVAAAAVVGLCCALIAAWPLQEVIVRPLAADCKAIDDAVRPEPASGNELERLWLEAARRDARDEAKTCLGDETTRRVFPITWILTGGITWTLTSGVFPAGSRPRRPSATGRPSPSRS